MTEPGPSQHPKTLFPPNVHDVHDRQGFDVVRLPSTSDPIPDTVVSAWQCSPRS